MKPRTLRERRLLRTANRLLEAAIGDEYDDDATAQASSAQRDTSDNAAVDDDPGLIRANAGSMGQDMAENAIRALFGDVGPRLRIRQAGIGASGTPDIAIVGIDDEGAWDLDGVTINPPNKSGDFPSFNDFDQFFAIEVKFGDATIDVSSNGNALMFSVQHEDGFLFCSGGGGGAAIKFSVFNDELEKFLQEAGAPTSQYTKTTQQAWCDQQAAAYKPTDTFRNSTTTRLYSSGANRGQLRPRRRGNRWEITVKYDQDSATAVSYGNPAQTLTIIRWKD